MPHFPDFLKKKKEKCEKIFRLTKMNDDMSVQAQKIKRLAGNLDKYEQDGFGGRRRVQANIEKDVFNREKYEGEPSMGYGHKGGYAAAGYGNVAYGGGYHFHSWGFIFLWWIILAIIFFFVFWVANPAFVKDGGHKLKDVNLGRVLAAALITALIVIIIIGIIIWGVRYA